MWSLILLGWFGYVEPPSAVATDRFWVATSGNFNVASNWSGNVVPGTSDRALFNQGSAGYTVTFTQSNTNAACNVANDPVTFSLGGFGYTLTGSGTIGDAAGNVGRLTLQNGTFTVAFSGGAFVVGNAGSGSLDFGTGGHLTTLGSTIIGSQANSSGVINIASSGTGWSELVGLTIGKAGSGRLTVNGGTFLSIGSVNIASDANSTGTMAIFGGGVATLSDALTVGSRGAGFLSINGSLVSGGTTLGSQLGSSGEVSMANGGHWTNSSFVSIGNAGTGTLTLQNGATGTSTFVSVGGNGGGSGFFSLVGSGTSWTAPSGVLIGSTGAGQVRVNTQATLTSGGARIGFGTGTSGSISINGGHWDSSIGSPLVGYGGDGQILVSGGGSASLLGLQLGIGSGAIGTLDVSEVDSSVVSSADWFIGSQGGDATVSIRSGGAASCTFATVGDTAGNGTVIIDGAGSSWTNGTGSLTLGADSGAATLNVTNAGRLVSNGAQIGASPGSAGTVLISAAGAAWNSTGSIFVGGGAASAGGAGSLTVGLGGQLLMSNISSIRIWPNGVVNLAGGQITTGSIDLQGGAFNFASGTLNLFGAAGYTINAASALGATVQLDPGKTLFVAQTLTVDPDSLLILTGGNASAGSLTNNGEILLASRASSLSVGGSLNNSGLIDGDGRISGQLSNSATGEVRADPGNRISFSNASVFNTNFGQINLLGGTVEFDDPLHNGAGGRISGRGTLVVRGAGLSLDGGTLALSGGTSDIFGTVTNGPSATIIVTGGSTSTFYDNVINNAGSEFRVSTNSTSVFLGNVTGLGQFTGPGTKDFEASASAGPLITSGSSIVGPSATLSASVIREHALGIEGVATVQPDGTTAGTSRIDDLAIEGSPGAWTGKFDLSNNDLIIDYDVTSPLPTVREQIASGFNHGAWNGNGITSSLAGSGKALGYLDNATRGLATFSGQSVDSTSILIKYTFAGDSNLDGQVDVTDLGALATNWQTPSDWTGGDFNYDGFVDVTDLGLLATNWQAGVGNPLGPGSLDSALAQVGLSAAGVPEPALTIVLLPLWILQIRRRRARRASCCRIPLTLSFAPCENIRRPIVRFSSLL